MRCVSTAATIEAEDRPTKGVGTTTFADEGLMGASTATVAQPITVGLVDDHELLRRGVRQTLKGDRRIKVVGEAASGSEAVHLLQQLHPHVVILDIKLGQDSGIDVARIAKTIAPKTKILVFTAYDYTQYVTSLVKLGVVGYLLKTASARELKRAVHDAAQGRLVFAPEVAGRVMSVVEKTDDQFSSQKRVDANLTKRETEVLQCIGRGLRNSEIASVMGIALKTVETHVQRILQKLGAKSRTQAVLSALRRGLLREVPT